MKKPLAAIASAVVLMSVSAFGQAQAPMASADPAVVKATREMLTAIKAREMMTNMLAQMEQQMPLQNRAAAAAVINGNPKLTPQQKADELKKAEAEIQASSAQLHAVFADPTLVDDMIAEMVPLYAESFTLDEIRQLTAFYSSPVGQKMQAMGPALMGRSMEISQRVIGPRMQKLMKSEAR